MSDLSDSDNSSDGGDWAVVNAQGDLDVSDGSSSTSSSSIEIVEMEELEEAAVQGEGEKSNPQSSFPQFVAEGEGMGLQQLMNQAGEADNMQPLQAVGSEVVTAPVAAASFLPLQNLLFAVQEPSRTSPSRTQPEGEETESETVPYIQTSQDRISYADKMSETERILLMEQTTQTDTAASELSDHRLSLSSLWSFSLGSGVTDETNGSDCGSVETDHGEQNSPVATESSSDTQDHQEKDQQPEKEQQADISAPSRSSGPEVLQSSPPQHPPREQAVQELVQPQHAKSSESQQKAGSSPSPASPGPEHPQSPPQCPPREQAVQELVQPQHAKSSESQEKAGSSPSPASPGPEHPQSPPQLPPRGQSLQVFVHPQHAKSSESQEKAGSSPSPASPGPECPEHPYTQRAVVQVKHINPYEAEAHVSQGPQRVSFRYRRSEEEAASPDTKMTTSIQLTVGPSSDDTGEDLKKKKESQQQLWSIKDIGIFMLLTLIIGAFLGLMSGLSRGLEIQKSLEEQLQQALGKHKHCVSEFGYLKEQKEAALQGERAMHEKMVRELQDQHQVLTQHLKEAQQQVEDLQAERKQQTTERTSSEESSTPGQDKHDQKAAEMWRHLYLSLKEEREIGVMNASSCIQRINSTAILQYLSQCWEESQVWTENVMDTSFWLSGLSSLQEKAARHVSAAVKEMPSAISETYQALFRTIFQSAQHQPHNQDTQEDGEKEGWGGSVDENEEDVTIEGEEELEMKSQEYKAYGENKHRRKWIKAFNRFLKKTQKVMFRVGNKLHKTWRKIKNKSVQFWSEKPAFGRMAAKLRNNINTLYSRLQKKTQDLFKEHSEAKHEEQRKNSKQGDKETEKKVSDKDDENEQKERMTKQGVEEENKERRAAAASFQIQSKFQQLYSKVGSMNVEDWVHTDAAELMKDMELVYKQYDSLHLDLPVSGRQWLACQRTFWTSLVAHRELSQPSLECSEFMAPWQLAVIEEQNSANSPLGKIQEHSASGKDNPWTSADHTDMHNSNSDKDDHQCSGDDCHA